MSEFFVYDGADRVGVLEHWTSVQWLEHYAAAGEAKIVCLATAANTALLTAGRTIYNPDTGTAMHIVQQELEDTGRSATLTLRCTDGPARLAARVVMGTVQVQDAEMGMLAIAKNNLRGLSMTVDAAAGLAVTVDTQVSWGSVLEGCVALARLSGLGFGCRFDPHTGTERFFVRQGVDRTAGEAYNGYLGDDVANLTNLRLTRGASDLYTAAVVCGEGEGADRAVVTVGEGEGDERRELYVDARDLTRTGQVAVDTGATDADGNPIYEYTSVTYTEAEYVALLTARGLEKLAENGTTLTMTAEAVDGGTLTYGVDYGVGDILPIKLTKYGVLAAARVTGVKLVYEAGGRKVYPILGDFKVQAAAAALNTRTR